MAKRARMGTNQWLAFVRSTFPNAFYFKDLTDLNLDEVGWSSLVALEDPLFLQMTKDQLNPVLEALVSQGMGPATPCGLLVGGSLNPEIRTSRIADVAALARSSRRATQYLIVSDDLSKLNAEEPAVPKLEGAAVLVTRARAQASELTGLLEEQGAQVFEVPTIEIVLQNDALPALNEAIEKIADYTWLLLTSVNSVLILNDALRHLGVDWKVFDGVRIGCIGTTTAARVRDFGGNVSLVPPKFQAESWVEALLSEEVDGKKVLLPRAQGSRELLPRELRHNGAIVNEIHIYSAKLPESGRAELADILKEQSLDFITFTSSST